MRELIGLFAAALFGGAVVAGALWLGEHWDDMKGGRK